MRFEAHGSPVVEITDSMLILEARHSINEEGMRELLRKNLRAARGFQGRSWVVLARIRGPVLLTPEAECLLHDQLPALISSGHTAIAIVAGENSTRWLLERQLQRIHSQSASPFQVFDTDSEARRWLSQFIGDDQVPLLTKPK